MPTKIVLLTSNPKGTESIDVEGEAATIKSLLDGDPRFVVDIMPAARIDEFRSALLDAPRPTIVQFCGHGARGGAARSRGSISASAGDDDEPAPVAGRLLVRDDTGRAIAIVPEALAELFGLLRGVSCVVLNACFTREQAELLKDHVPYVIGTTSAIPDPAAIEFSRAFYQTARRGTESLRKAFEVGRNSIAQKALGDPNLYCEFVGEGANPDKLFLVQRPQSDMWSRLLLRFVDSARDLIRTGVVAVFVWALLMIVTWLVFYYSSFDDLRYAMIGAGCVYGFLVLVFAALWRILRRRLRNSRAQRPAEGDDRKRDSDEPSSLDSKSTTTGTEV
jgi:hypothetical protein